MAEIKLINKSKSLLHASWKQKILTPDLPATSMASSASLNNACRCSKIPAQVGKGVLCWNIPILISFGGLICSLGQLNL